MRVIISFFIFLIGTTYAFAINEGMPIIRNFKAEAYEGGSRIYSLVTTKDGLLYAGDKTGIIEFDGENWNKIYSGFAITSLAADSNDVVYVAGSKGIGKLVPDSTNTITYKSLNQIITTEKDLKKFRFAKVFNIKDRIIYVLGKEIIINTPENIRILETSHDFIYYQKLDDELYFYSEEEGVYQLVENKLKLINNNEQIKNKRVVGFLNYKNQLHVLMEEVGIYNLELNKLSLSEQIISKLNQIKLHGIDQIDDTTYALKTYYSGVLLFNSKGDIFKKYSYEEGLVNNTVFSVFKDYWNNLWIGTASGISSIRLNFPFTKFNNHHGIGTGYASTFYKNTLYFATSQGLYYSQKNSKDNLEFIKLFDGHVWGLHLINDILYFGSPGGIYSWDNKQIKQVTFYPGGWNLAKINDNNNYYISGSPVGLLLLKHDKQLEYVRLLKGINGNTRNIIKDEQNNFWAEFENGLYRFGINNDLTEIENLRTFDRIEFNNKLKQVIKYKGEVYFVADSGIYLYNKAQGFYKDTAKFKSIYKEKRIPSNIIIDRFNRWWMFGNGEMHCYTISDKGAKRLHYSLTEFANDKYPIDYENIFSLDSTFLIIGQEEGFLGYNLGMKYNGTYSANRVRRIIITSPKGKVKTLTGNEKTVNWVQYGDIDKGIKYGTSIKFYYSAGCSKHNSVKYATFLHGFDEKWPQWNNETVKEYTNLTKGEYKFIVRSINKSGEESTPAIYSFTVLPPWYLTIYSKITYVLLFVMIIIFIRKRISHHTKNLKQKLQKEQEEILYRKEQTQIQENLKKQQEIVKLRNEKLRIDNLYKSKELANSTMGVIKKNQFLTELKEELEKIKAYAEKNKLVTGDVKDVIRKIDRDIDNEENWKVFEDYFDRVHEKFLKRLKAKYPILTSKDLRLSAYLRMNLSTKEIAPLMNITVRGVEISRYRLRKKLEIDRNDNLNEFLLQF